MEVIVVDDGSEPPIELTTGGVTGSIRLIRIRHQGVSAARAAGLAAARGEFVAYCDDDDEWTPDHLRVLLDVIRDEPAVALVYGDAVWNPPSARPAGEASVDGDSLERGRAGFASDALHRAEAARDAGGFDPTLPAHEDWDLWLRMQLCHQRRHVPTVVTTHHATPGRIMATEHPEARDLVSGGLRVWRMRSARTDRVRRNAGGVVPFEPATWTAERRQLLWQSTLSNTTSFERVARRLIPAVERQGVDVAIGPLRLRCPKGFERLHRSRPGRERLGFHYDSLIGPEGVGCERLIHYGMWETTLVPCDQVAMINRAVTLLYVPCRHNVETFRERGVRVPIKVLHHGVDPAEFPMLERSDREVFTFGSHGNLGSARKGADVLVRAFRAEFAPHEPVRLVVHCTYPSWVKDWLHRAAAEDPRIELVTGNLSHAGLLALLRRLDAFILSSRGEGFGLTALEAMATGLPTIATGWSGPVEYLDPADSFALGYRLVESAGTHDSTTRYFGRWAEPDVEHLRALLRHLYENPAAARAMGRRAAARVHAGWTWDRPAAQIVADLDLLAQGISPDASD